MCVAFLDGYETRKETGHFRLDLIDGHAGFIKRGFNNGMALFGISTHDDQWSRPTAYLRIELKLYQRSLLGFKTIGRELELSILVRDLDSMDLDRATG